MRTSFFFSLLCSEMKSLSVRLMYHCVSLVTVFMFFLLQINLIWLRTEQMVAKRVVANKFCCFSCSVVFLTAYGLFTLSSRQCLTDNSARHVDPDSTVSIKTRRFIAKNDKFKFFTHTTWMFTLAVAMTSRDNAHNAFYVSDETSLNCDQTVIIFALFINHPANRIFCHHIKFASLYCVQHLYNNWRL